MHYQTARPSYSLTPWIKQYWAIQSALPEGKTHIQRIVPTGLTELTIYLGDYPKVSDDRMHIRESLMLSGQSNRHFDLSVQRNISLFSILFHPYALSVLFDLPSSELFNHSVPLSDILKHETNELEDLLNHAVSFGDKVAVVESFLHHRLRKKEHSEHFHRIASCIHQINMQGGNTDIDFLASEACLSRKQFERIFAELIGISPKQFLKTIRFQHAIHQKACFPHLNLTELSYQAGYYDQSHMTHDFIRLSGMTPKQYFGNCDPVSDYFTP